MLFRVHVEAMIAVLGRKKAERYLQTMAEAFANEENLSTVFQIRPQSDWGDVNRARRQASLVFRRYLPIFLARLPMK